MAEVVGQKLFHNQKIMTTILFLVVMILMRYGTAASRSVLDVDKQRKMSRYDTRGEPRIEQWIEMIHLSGEKKKEEISLTFFVVTSLTLQNLFENRAVPMARLVSNYSSLFEHDALIFFASNTSQAQKNAFERGCTKSSDDDSMDCPELYRYKLIWLDCHETKWGAAGPCCKVDRAFRWYALQKKFTKKF